MDVGYRGCILQPPRSLSFLKVWHCERGVLSTAHISYLPGEPQVTVLHDGRECLVTTQVSPGGDR